MKILWKKEDVIVFLSLIFSFFGKLCSHQQHLQLEDGKLELIVAAYFVFSLLLYSFAERATFL